ncbi:MAG TPA: hypothetical protein VG916_07730, partial [Gemmatimonadaceae bacterium]|nr:hypothetical protein [Gemmatimonadaceae bacterium]
MRRRRTLRSGSTWPRWAQWVLTKSNSRTLHAERDTPSNLEYESPTSMASMSAPSRVAFFSVTLALFASEAHAQSPAGAEPVPPPAAAP